MVRSIVFDRLYARACVYIFRIILIHIHLFASRKDPVELIIAMTRKFERECLNYKEELETKVNCGLRID